MHFFSFSLPPIPFDHPQDLFSHSRKKEKPDLLFRFLPLFFILFLCNNYWHNSYRRYKNMRLSGRILIIIVVAITAVSALFSIIGLATKQWPGGIGIFCDGCPKTTAALSVISFILLIFTIVAFVLLMFDILRGILQIIPFILLFIATIFLLSTFASHFNVSSAHSYNLIVVAHFLSYIALAISAYWYGQTEATSATTG